MTRNGQNYTTKFTKINIIVRNGLTDVMSFYRNLQSLVSKDMVH